jgi:hypothetical protein
MKYKEKIKLHDDTLLVRFFDTLRACSLFFREDELLFFGEETPLRALCHGFPSALALLLRASVRIHRCEI